MYYRPTIGVAADVIPFYENGEFKLIYLHDFRNIEQYGEGCPWNLLTTKDFLNYTDHGQIIKRGSKADQDLYIYTGCVFKWDNEYFVFYTGHNPHLRAQGLNEQKIMLARGADLLNLQKVHDFSFESPNFLEIHDFRDPFVYHDEEDGLFKMLLASRLKHGPIKNRGVTMIAHSKNLLDWEVLPEPFYGPMAYYTHECPDYFKMGEYYYLIFSEFSDRFTTRYVYKKTSKGPWIVPKNDSFDGHAFYAAKSVSDGKRRFLFGWNPIKLNEKDNDFWQWGGNIIPHEVIQNEDGTLNVKLPNEISVQYQSTVENSFHVVSGFDYDNHVLTSKKSDYAYALLNVLPKNSKIEFDFEIEKDSQDFGVILKSDDYKNDGYLVKFEPKYNRMVMDKMNRKDVTVHHMADTEVFVEYRFGSRNHVQLIVEGSTAVCYINDRFAMNFRMFDIEIGRLGFYSNQSLVKLSNIKISGFNHE